jgi:hypothetical protein
MRILSRRFGRRHQVLAQFGERILCVLGSNFAQPSPDRTPATALWMSAAAADGSDASPVLFVLVTALYFAVYGRSSSPSGHARGHLRLEVRGGPMPGCCTAKGAGSLLVPVAAILAKDYGWGAVFTVGMCFNIIAALLGLFVLRPMRIRHFAKEPQRVPHSGNGCGIGAKLGRYRNALIGALIVVTEDVIWQ